MTRLDRVLDLLKRYDGLAQAGVNNHDSILGRTMLNELREEKEQLTKELIEHGCRRKN
jgi:hypothetical protein